MNSISTTTSGDFGVYFSREVPTDLHLLLSSFLPLADLQSWKQTCKPIYDIIQNNPKVWNAFLRTLYPRFAAQLTPPPTESYLCLQNIHSKIANLPVHFFNAQNLVPKKLAYLDDCNTHFYLRGDTLIRRQIGASEIDIWNLLSQQQIGSFPITDGTCEHLHQDLSLHENFACYYAQYKKNDEIYRSLYLFDLQSKKQTIIPNATASFSIVDTTLYCYCHKDGAREVQIWDLKQRVLSDRYIFENIPDCHDYRHFVVDAEQKWIHCVVKISSTSFSNYLKIFSIHLETKQQFIQAFTPLSSGDICKIILRKSLLYIHSSSHLPDMHIFDLASKKWTPPPQGKNVPRMYHFTKNWNSTTHTTLSIFDLTVTHTNQVEIDAAPTSFQIDGYEMFLLHHGEIYSLDLTGSTPSPDST